MSLETHQTDDINSLKCKRIMACIDTFLAKNVSLTLQNIENKTGVPYTTLSRIKSLKGNPQEKVVIKIFRGLGFDKDLHDYLQDFHPEIAEIMGIRNSHNSEYQYVDESVREYFTSEDYFLIMTLAYTNSGTTAEEISFELGQRGLEKLAELNQKGLIIQLEDGRYIGKLENYKLSFSDTKERIRLSLQHYRINEAGSINNWMSFQTESINEEGIIALKDLHQKQYNERKELIFNNSMFNGNIKVFSATVSSTLIAKNNSGVQ